MSAATWIEITRHYAELSENETDAVVKAVAGLIVGYLKTNPQSGEEASAEAPTGQQCKEQALDQIGSGRDGVTH